MDSQQSFVFAAYFWLFTKEIYVLICISYNSLLRHNIKVYSHTIFVFAIWITFCRSALFIYSFSINNQRWIIISSSVTLGMKINMASFLFFWIENRQVIYCNLEVVSQHVAEVFYALFPQPYNSHFQALFLSTKVEIHHRIFLWLPTKSSLLSSFTNKFHSSRFKESLESIFIIFGKSLIYTLFVIIWPWSPVLWQECLLVWLETFNPSFKG